MRRFSVEEMERLVSRFAEDAEVTGLDLRRVAER